MYIRVTATPNSPRKSVKVVASIREGLKVRQVMILHVGVAADEHEIEKLKQLGREFIAREQIRRDKESQQGSLFESDSPEERLRHIEGLAKLKREKIAASKRKPRLQDVPTQDLVSLSELSEEQRVVEGIHEVAGHVYGQLGYSNLLPRLKDQELLKDLVLMRLAEPSSKHMAQQILHKRFNRTHDLDAIYRLMDKIYTKIDDIKLATFKRTKEIIPKVIDILFFDCTTLYFESTETDELRKFGYSKDHRFNTTQVVLALATNSDGLPVGYELFEGNKAEVKTLLSCLESWKKNFDIGTVCFVADRAMMSDDNLKALEDQKYSYVVAAKLRSMPNALKTEILLEKNYKAISFGEYFGWVGEFDYKSRRMIVSYKTDRARRDAHQRYQVVEKIQKRLAATSDTQRLITNHGVKRYTKSEDSKTIIDQGKIDEDAKWDGIHGIISNIKEESAVALLARYSRLWKIEESFRINKHTLSMRPIYHFKPERIKAHIAICYMAYSVLRNMEYVVKVTQKISLETMLDELIHVQASIYRHMPTGRLYRVPGKFTHNATKIYRAFQLQRKHIAQEIIQN